MKKVTPTLGYSLAIISILGFITIIANTWFSFDFLTPYTSGLILMILGVGLIVEAQFKTWKYMKRHGISNDEIAHIVTGVVGVLSTVVGLLDIIGLSSIKFEAVKGLIASIAVVIIVIETWFVK